MNKRKFKMIAVRLDEEDVVNLELLKDGWKHAIVGRRANVSDIVRMCIHEQFVRQKSLVAFPVEPQPAEAKAGQPVKVPRKRGPRKVVEVKKSLPPKPSPNGKPKAKKKK